MTRFYAFSPTLLALWLASGCGPAPRAQAPRPPSAPVGSEPQELQSSGPVDDRHAEAIRADGDSDADGVLDVDDRCPNVPEDRDSDADDDGCPEAGGDDRDADGLGDSLDKCPDDPEDRDGFEDGDGCPDPDNDRDGIRDADDKCPNDPETLNGFEDSDGCPESR